MLEAFRKHLSLLVVSGQWSVVRQYSVPNNKQPHFLLAVSGGLDSIVMLELFFLAGYDFCIAHCNFQLRGKESDDDEKFVKNLAKEYDVPFYSIKFETEKFCTVNKLSIQMGARQLRYDWLEEIRQKNKLDYVVTAHHADDAIETFFINLIRGTGLSGLHGIKSKNGNVIRPMLHFYRNEIEKFAKENELKWREDSSNNSDKYERNKIRHHLLPELDKINPSARESVTATIEKLGMAEAILNDAVQKLTQKFIRTEDGRTEINFGFFKELNPAAGYLFEVLNKYGFNYNQCVQIVESVKGQPGKVFLSESHKLSIDREKLIIEPQKRKEKKNVFEIGKNLEELLTKTNTYFFRTRKMTKSFTIPKEPSVAAFDYEKLTFPLKIRKWEKGDKFYPLGMKKSQKLSDFLINNKVAMPDKDQVHVLISGKEIVWVIGYRLDERYKVTTATKNLYLCRLEKASTHE